MRMEVIIPNYNGEGLLPGCLDSLFRQTRPAERVTVVDNGSSDRSGQVIRDHPLQPRLLSLPENRGFAAAVNLGIKESDADVVALLNNDMVCDPRWIEIGEKALQSRQQASMAASLILKSADRDQVDAAGDTYPPQARPAHIAHGKRAAAFEHDCLEVLSACAGAAFYRKSMFDDTGYFEESFFAYLEDVDLGLRARSKGHLCLFTPRAVTYHAGAATLLADKSSRKPVDSSFRVRWIAENRIRVMARNLPASWLIIWSPLIGWGFIKSAAYHLAVSRQARPFHKGIARGFAKWRQDRDYFRSQNHPALFETRALIREGFRPWQS